jgi:hypothetical protein
VSPGKTSLQAGNTSSPSPHTSLSLSSQRNKFIEQEFLLRLDVKPLSFFFSYLKTFLVSFFFLFFFFFFFLKKKENLISTKRQNTKVAERYVFQLENKGGSELVLVLLWFFFNGQRKHTLESAVSCMAG